VLNNDVIVSPGFLGAMIYALQRTPKAGIAGPLVYSSGNPSSVISAGGRINLVKGKTTDILSARPETSGLSHNEVEFVQGCCMLISRKVFERIGLFNEGYFMYFEDTDLCVRARRNGFKIIVVPTSIIRHKVSASTGYLSKTAYYYFTRNRILFVNWNSSTLDRALFQLYFLMYYVPGFLAYSVLARRPDLVRALLAGVISARKVLRSGTKLNKRTVNLR
jgi:GT2 family glycosyltransferase